MLCYRLPYSIIRKTANRRVFQNNITRRENLKMSLLKKLNIPRAVSKHNRIE